MNKFKFGDKVLDENLGECVVINTLGHSVFIMNEEGYFDALANPDHLKLIPHPDTVRLDFIQNNNVQILNNATYRKDVDKEYDGEDYITNLQRTVDFDGNEGMAEDTIQNNIREAIDEILEDTNLLKKAIERDSEESIEVKIEES